VIFIVYFTRNVEVSRLVVTIGLGMENKEEMVTLTVRVPKRFEQGYRNVLTMISPPDDGVWDCLVVGAAWVGERSQAGVCIGNMGDANDAHVLKGLGMVAGSMSAAAGEVVSEVVEEDRADAAAVYANGVLAAYGETAKLNLSTETMAEMREKILLDREVSGR
jgi:hypothetical protein